MGATTPPASSCSKDTSVAACSVLNSSTILYMFGWLFPARSLILLCHPSTWLFVHGPFSLYTDHSTSVLALEGLLVLRPSPIFLPLLYTEKPGNKANSLPVWSMVLQADLCWTHVHNCWITPTFVHLHG